jgi:hypothetical protein
MKKLCFGGIGVALVAVACVGGCSSNKGAAPDTSSVDAYVQSLAQAACDWEFRCCKDAEIKTLVGTKYTTKEDCLPYQQLAVEDGLYLARLAVRDGRVRLDATHSAACLQQQQSKVCNPPPNTPPPPPNTATDCSHAFAGTTAVGAECIYANECVDGAHCVGDAAAIGHGVCVPYQKVGDICNTASDCDPATTGIYCAKQDYKCHVRGKLGEACAYTTDSGSPTLPMLLECDTTTTPGIFCDPNSKTCASPPGDGQPCLATPLPPGVASRCNPDPTLQLVCDSSTGTGGTCRAPGKVGANCSALPCAADLYCDTTGYVCTALPGLGSPCIVSGERCAKPYFCNTNKSPAVCDQPAGLGQDCSIVTCDTGLYCDTLSATRTCKAQLPDGTTCTSSLQCASQICTGTCQPRQTPAQCTGR